MANSEAVQDTLPLPIRNGDRLAQACGILAVACILVAGAVSPDPPSHGAADDAVRAFYQQHGNGILTGNFLWDVGMTALMVFATAMSRSANLIYTLRNKAALEAGRTALLSADLICPLSAAAACTFLVSQGIQGAAAVMAMRGALPNTVRALDEAAHIVSHLGTLPLGSLVLAAGVAQAVSRSVARWIGWLGMAVGAGLMVTTSWIAIGQFWIHNAGVLCLLVFLLWTLATSIAMLLRRRVVPE